MSSPNQYPTSEEKHSAQPETVQYNDGAVTLVFKTPGDLLKLGNDSKFKYAQNLDTKYGNMVIVRTKSGNAYGIGHGVVINARESMAHRLPHELPDIEIGKSWLIPGVSQTSDIESVQFNYKSADQGYGDRQIDQPSPFPA
jgi:hypothetical protein